MKSIRDSHMRSILSWTLCLFLGTASTISAQDVANPQKYKLTVVNASTSKRAKKNRVASQSVVRVTDQNNVPVSGVAVTFTIPQFTGGGAAFANGAATSIVTTNAAGVATSGTFTTVGSTSFSLGVGAAVPGGVVSTTVPVAISAAAVAGGVSAGISTGLLVGIIGGVGAAVATGVVVATKNSSPSGTIGSAGAPTFGHP
jgi:hypothetical protein